MNRRSVCFKSDEHANSKYLLSMTAPASGRESSHLNGHRFVILWSLGRVSWTHGRMAWTKWQRRTENKQFYHPVLKHTRFFGSFSTTKKYNFAMYIPCGWAWTSAYKFYEIPCSIYIAWEDLSPPPLAVSKMFCFCFLFVRFFCCCCCCFFK